MTPYLALAVLLFAQLEASGSTSIEVSPEVLAKLDYSDLTGVHPELADQGKRLIRQMWASTCGQDGTSCMHGPYIVKLTITETDMGMSCLGNIAGKAFDRAPDGSYKIEDVWFGCSADGRFIMRETQELPQIETRPR